MTSAEQRLKYVYRVVDQRAGVSQPPLLAVSIHRGVVPRNMLTDDLPRAEDLSNYKLCEKGDIVLNRMRAFQGAIGISPMRGIVSPDYMVLRPFLAAEARYLHHLFRSHWFVGEMSARLRGIGGTENGSVRTPRINPEDLGDIRVSLPSLEEQRRIADFLDAETARLDHLISLFTKQRDLVSERERAALSLTVGGALLAGRQVKSGVPWFPEAHPEALIVPLVRVLQLQRGVDLAESQRRPGQIPVFTTAGRAGWHDKAIAGGPGVVIGRYGSVGNVHWTNQPYWPHNTTLYVKNFNGNDERYCYHLLRALPYEMEQARAAVPGVNRNDLHKQLVPLLPRPLQLSASKQADEQMSRLRATHTRIERAKALLTERRQALITAAVTGQFDVSTASGRGVDAP
ncbi:restriction endonuclease subunit S [Streptomyces europaeiscabiei]|uniref:restriction endonuclease subunit S n=1 Tax=Streptomyces europaeiscabiei TaxID=146819 RepID=UPI0029B6075D|nr:restriction endonuclease subunit S [Streptomyces europaeiscabiei]MDX3779748.1 restriction endonuclease subunit S [Streptomyces europaeiscabiei]